jgi:hypothetical protein
MMLSSIAFRREFEWPRAEFNRADDRVTRLFADEHKPAFTFTEYSLRRVTPERTRPTRARLFLQSLQFDDGAGSMHNHSRVVTVSERPSLGAGS